MSMEEEALSPGECWEDPKPSSFLVAEEEDLDTISRDGFDDNDGSDEETLREDDSESVTIDHPALVPGSPLQQREVLQFHIVEVANCHICDKDAYGFRYSYQNGDGLIEHEQEHVCFVCALSRCAWQYYTFEDLDDTIRYRPCLNCIHYSFGGPPDTSFARVIEAVNDRVSLIHSLGGGVSEDRREHMVEEEEDYLHNEYMRWASNQGICEQCEFDPDAKRIRHVPMDDKNEALDFLLAYFRLEKE